MFSERKQKKSPEILRFQDFYGETNRNRYSVETLWLQWLTTFYTMLFLAFGDFI